MIGGGSSHFCESICPRSCDSIVIRGRRVSTTSLQMNTGNGSGKPLVPILMGSMSDLKHCEAIADALSELGLASEMRVASAHKVPERLLGALKLYETDGRPKVYVAVAGRSNALSGVLDAAVSAPVVSCPPRSDAFGGADLFSSIRMPGGVAPALVLDPVGCALFCAKVLGMVDKDVAGRVVALQERGRMRLVADDAELRTRSYKFLIEEARHSAVRDTAAVFCGRKGVKGKVRDRYEIDGMDGQRLLALVTTDRQSAFDRVLAAVPYKGAVLNMTSAWWFENTTHIVPNHVVAVPHPNVTVARACDPFPIEFVVRGYITGSTSTSLWTRYNAGEREYCGHSFSDGLRKNQQLPVPLLTPTTKAEAGDRPISAEAILNEGIMSPSDFEACKKAALALFEFGQEKARANGLILVDTKYEFGRSDDGVIRLIDEIHTPDSSRYWIAASYDDRFARMLEPENVDKEFLRLWFVDNSKPYDKDTALPEAPVELVNELSRKYIMLYELITGERFDFAVADRALDDMAAALVPYMGTQSAVGAV